MTTRVEEMVSGLRPGIKLLQDDNPWGMEPLVFTVFCLRYLVNLKIPEIVACLMCETTETTLQKRRVSNMFTEYRWTVLRDPKTDVYSDRVVALKEAVGWHPSVYQTHWDNTAWLPLLDEIGVVLPAKKGRPRLTREEQKFEIFVEPLIDEIDTILDLDAVETEESDAEAEEIEEISPDNEPSEAELLDLDGSVETDTVEIENSERAVIDLDRSQRRKTAYPFKEIRTISSGKRSVHSGSHHGDGTTAGFKGNPTPPPYKPNACPRCRTSEMILQRGDDFEGSARKCLSCGHEIPEASFASRPADDFADTGKPRQRRRHPYHGKQNL